MDNMPPLPEPNDYICTQFSDGSVDDVPHFSAAQMHAYARAYAEQRVRPLVEALGAIVTDLMDGDDFSAAQIARHAGRAALAAEQERSNG